MLCMVCAKNGGCTSAPVSWSPFILYLPFLPLGLFCSPLIFFPHFFCFSSPRFTGKHTSCINLGSYNYLGFAQNEGPCADAAVEAVYKYGVGSPSTVRDLGETNI